MEWMELLIILKTKFYNHQMINLIIPQEYRNKNLNELLTRKQKNPLANNPNVNQDIHMPGMTIIHLML